MDIEIHSNDNSNSRNKVMQQKNNQLSLVSSSLVFNLNNYNTNYNNNNGGDRNNLLDLPSRPQIDWSNENYKPEFKPFDGDRNVTAQLGKSTFLRCRIKQITDETVSKKRQEK